MTNKIGIYLEWTAAKKDTWFTTRSPHPELPCYISPAALPRAENFGANMPYDAPVLDVKQYLTAQVRILRFNNPEHTPFMVKAAILSRIMYWMGNRVLQRDPYFLTTLLDEITEECFKDDFMDYIKYWDKTKYWYSDEITKMSGKGSQGSPRFKAKLAARQAIFAEGYRDDLEVASGEYRRDNLDVLPTVKELTENVAYSKGTVIKYGKDLYIPTVDNTRQKVQRAKAAYPELTQREIASILEVSIRTVKEYWNIKKGEGE